MPVKPILLLGNPKLFNISEKINRSEIPYIKSVVDDLHDTMMDFRERHGAGRAIAAPQIGVFKRLVYMNIDRPVVYINPVFHDPASELIELWDDCMSFPDILVRVKRHNTIRIRYRDLNWQEHDDYLESDLAELLQHEVDHLDGILATMRAVDNKSIILKSQIEFIK